MDRRRLLSPTASVIGATLDRNGLRPGRYIVTKDDLVVLASEAGVLDVPAEDIRKKGRLQPGRMFLVDTVQQRIISDERDQEAVGRPAALWRVAEGAADHAGAAARAVARDCVESRDAAAPPARLRLQRRGSAASCWRRWAPTGEEPIGSMGTDMPLACLSDRPQPLFNYFKQLFAQVTNPPIDPIREELVMSLISYIGTERNILDETPENCHTLKLPHPILTNRDLEKLRRVSSGDLLATTLPTLFRAEGWREGAEARAGRLVPPRLARHQLRLHAADSLRPRRGSDVCAHPQPAGDGRRAQSSGAGKDAHAGGADHRERRAARSDAFCAADRLRRQRHQSVPGDRDAADMKRRGLLPDKVTPSTR